MTPEEQAAADAAAAAAATTKPDTTTEPELTLTPEPKPEPKPEPVTYEPTGNATVDAIGDLLASKNVKDTSAIMEEFTATGELSLANKALLVEALGETVAKVALQQLDTVSTNIQETVTKKRTEVLDYALTKFEGAEDPETTWQQIQEFARSEDSGFTDEDLESLTSMLNRGGMTAQLAIDKIAEVYYSQPGTSTSADLLEGDVYTSGTFEPLSKQDYVSEMRNAVRKYGEHSPEVKALDQRRIATIRRGLN